MFALLLALAATSSLVSDGEALAKAKCQTCHAIARDDQSTNPKSPPLRILARKYPIETLSEAFAEGILVGHSNMPAFELEPVQIDALLAYIKSIQTPEKPLARKRKARSQARP